MATFFYRCKYNDEIIKGTIDAQNIAQASSKLQDKQYVVLEIKQINNINSTLTLAVDSTPFNIKEKKDFYNSLAKQYKSGIAFLQIFNNIITSASTKNVKGIAFKIMRKLQKGDSIADVFTCFSPYIGKTYASLIIAGDASGSLDVVLSKISAQVNEEENIISSIKSKTTYPLIIVCLMFFVLQIVFFFILPVFNQIADGADVELNSMVTSALLKIATTTSIFAVLFVYMLKTKTLAKISLGNLCNIKPIKEVLESYYFSNFFTILALAQEAGLSPNEAIELSKDAILDKNISSKFDNILNMLSNGCKISTAFAVSSIFSDYAQSQIDSGEASGNLTATYNDISQDYKNTFNQKLDFFIKTLEVVLIVLISIVVLIVCSKVFLKYYEAIFSMF